MKDHKRENLNKIILEKKLKWFLVLGSILIVWVGFFRPDITLAMRIIDNANKYPEGDIKVKAATEYLILTEHPKTYPWLRSLFWSSRKVVDNPRDFSDYTAIQASYILGKYKSKRAEEILVDIVTFEYGGDGPPDSVHYAFEGLLMKGDIGYEVIRKIAIGESVKTHWFRNISIRKLGSSWNQEYFDTLVDIALSDPYYYYRGEALKALVELNKYRAEGILQHVVENDESDYVIEIAKNLLDN